MQRASIRFLISTLLAGSIGFSVRAHASVCANLFRAEVSHGRIVFSGPGAFVIDALVANRSIWPIENVAPRPGVAELVAQLAPSVATTEQVAAVLKASGKDDVHTVFYPAAGFDAGTAFRVFKKADVVIGLDNHPFAKTIEKDDGVSSAGVAKAESSEGWAPVSVINRLQYVSDAILASIRASGSVRILRVAAIEGEGSSGVKPVVHGVVEFDYGPGTKVRRYIHIQGPKTMLHSILPAWARALFMSRFEALFVKAAMGIDREPKSSLAGLIVENLRKRHGLIVDADGGATHWPWVVLPRETENLGVSTVDTKIKNLGYGNVHLVGF